MPFRALRPVAAVFVLLAAACSDGGEPAVPVRMEAVGGSAQTGVVGAPLDSALRVRVLDAGDRPVAGVPVAFVVAGGAGTVDPTSTTTDAQGIAMSRWTMPATVGVQSVWARVAGVDSVLFTATATAAGAASLTLTSPDSQTALVGEGLASAIIVQVLDAFGNPVSGATVTFTPAFGAGSVAPQSVPSAATGEAATVWTLPSLEGVYSLTATVGAASPVVTTALVFPPLPRQRLTVAASYGCWIPSVDPGPAYCWGDNSKLQLGTGLPVNAYSLVPVGGGLTFRGIAAGATFNAWAHTCGVTVDSVAYCWGTVPTDTSAFPSPLPLAPPGKGLTSITAGARHACALAVDGTAYCWGTNKEGQLGDGSTTDRSGLTPVAGDIHFRQLSAGESHTCGVSTRGVLYCWGDNLNGQVGNGVPFTDQLTPTAIATADRFSSVHADAVHSCALALGGALYCWGNDGRGEVTTGPGGTSTPVPPTLVPAIGTSDAFGLGYERTCIIKSGAASCWGNNYTFGLGDSSYGERHTPAPVLGALQFQAIAGGWSPTCGITVGNALYCWGENYRGALGQPDSTVILEPIAVAGGRTFTQISTGLWHTCALDAAGTAYCWGSHQWGIVGDGTRHPRSIPVPVAGGLVFSTISAGGYSTCGVTTAGAGYCWGAANIGDGQLLDREVPTPVAGNLTFTNISVGFDEACGLTTTGEAWCWGGSQQPLPRLVTGPEPFSLVTAGWSKSCGLGISGATYCWYPYSDTMTAALVGGGHTFTQVVTGNQYACGLTGTGAAYCWGLNALGSLGNESAGQDAFEPVPVSGNHLFTSLAVSSDGSTSCGISGGAAYCWGDNRSGQHGNGQIGDELGTSTAGAVNGGHQFATIDPSTTHTCALTSSGAAYCWGSGQHGALGTGASLSQPSPQLVRGQ